MVHGNGYIDQGVYIRRDEKVNGVVSYISPRPNKKYLLKGTSTYWVIEEISTNDIKGKLNIDTKIKWKLLEKLA